MADIPASTALARVSRAFNVPTVDDRLQSLKMTRRSINDAVVHANDDLMDIATDLQTQVKALQAENAALRGQRDLCRLPLLASEASQSNSSTTPSYPRPFAVVILDADAYVFRYHFLTRGAAGGREAADELLEKVRNYLEQDIGFDPSLDIIVKAYAYHGGLASVLQKCGFVQSEKDFFLFVEAFNQRVPLFEFLNVGSGKERADQKIRKWFEHYLNNVQCRHVLLGCGHDTGYTTFLEEYGASSRTRDRITIIQGVSMNVQFQQMGFERRLGLWTVFHDKRVEKTGKAPATLQPSQNFARNAKQSPQKSGKNTKTPEIQSKQTSQDQAGPKGKATTDSAAKETRHDAKAVQSTKALMARTTNSSLIDQSSRQRPLQQPQHPLLTWGRRLFGMEGIDLVL